MYLEPMEPKEDLEELLNINLTLVDKWYHYSPDYKKANNPVTWDELSEWERYLHGGAWNSPHLLKIHVDLFLRIGNIMVLKEQGNIIGELEYHLYDNYAHIDWLMISKNYQNSGKGITMIKLFTEYLNENNPEIKYIYTEPESGVEYFYKSIGFNTVKQYSEYRSPSMPTDTIISSLNWVNGIPELYEYNYGILPNNPHYIKFFLKLNSQMAKAFNSSGKTRYTSINYRDHNYILIEMIYSALPYRSRIIISSTHALNKEEINRFLKVAEFGLLAEQEMYTTIPYDNLSWPRFNTVSYLGKLL